MCYHFYMPQACPSCLWISSDEAEVCEHCGERFDGRPVPVVTASAIGGWVRVIVGLFALGLLAYLLYRRFGGDTSGLGESLKAAAVNFYTWLLGPNEIFKPYLIIIAVVTMIVWVVLWLLARLREA